MKFLVVLLILLLVACSPGAGRCACSLGGAGSYNFLSDPAVDINMDGYDEFERTNAAASSLASPNVQEAALSRLNLNLQDKASINLNLSKKERNFSGSGIVSRVNETESAAALGTLQGNRLSLDVTVSNGSIYKFDLASEGSTVLGDYTETLPDGMKLAGTVEGMWEIWKE